MANHDTVNLVYCFIMIPLQTYSFFTLKLAIIFQ
jgi:hypothetical protein